MSTTCRDVREIVREEQAVHGRILAALANGPLTVPQLAEALGYPTHEVVFWVMAMRRYGHLTEPTGADDAGYFRYQAKGGTEK